MNASKSIKQTLGRVALASAVCFLTLTSALALTNESHNLSADASLNNSVDATAQFKNAWIDHNVTDDGRKGMRIHVNFEVTGLKGVDSKIVARVDRGDGDFLASSTAYSNAEGELETSYSIKPGFSTSVYEDADMFLPYDAISLRKGVWNLKLDIDLNYEDGKIIQHLGYKEVVFTAPNFSADGEEKPAVTTTVNQVWIDYDVYEKRQRGMRIHVNFEVTGLKGVDSKLTARVRREDESFLTGGPSFSNDDGELELSYALKPGYPTSVFKDATLFLPYNAINLRKGVWNLKLDIDLNYPDGSLIEHLTYYEFEFSR